MPRKVTPNVSVAAREFIAQRYSRSKSTGVRDGFVSILGRFTRHVGDCHVGSLTPSHVEEFFYGRDGLHTTCATNTLGKYRNDLKQFFDFCERRDWITRSGQAMVSGVPDKSTKPNRDRYRLSGPEVCLLLDHAKDPRDRALAAFVANTGVRISEALAMRVCDVNLDKGEMYVKIIKTGGSVVTYPITSDLDHELRVWLTHYSQRAGIPFNRTSKVRLFPPFVRPHFGRKGAEAQTPVTDEYNLNPSYKISNPRTIIQYMAEGAGIELEPGDGWHTIRRSVARIFFDTASERGHDAALRITQAFLGHASAATTENYLGLDLERRKVMEVLQGQPFLTRPDDGATVVPMTRSVL